MPSTCRFMDLYKGENEWLAGEKPTDPKSNYAVAISRKTN